MIPEPHPLDVLRGEFPEQPVTARRLAAALEAPGCSRRAVLDAARVHLDKLSGLVTEDAQPARQSPFAMSRGHQFEAQVTENGMAGIVALVREHLGLTIPEVRQRDLSAPAVRELVSDLRGARMNVVRADLTRRAVQEMLFDPDSAYNLIRHAVTRLDFGGAPVYLEQDVLAFAVDGRLHVVEIKSFPRIDGRADPVQSSSALRQTAVYVLGLQRLVEEIGAPRDVVSTMTMIVLPENLTFTATGVTFDIRMQVSRLRRQLDDVPRATDVLAAAPAGLRLPALPVGGADADELSAARATAAEVLSHIPMRFTDGCVSCPLFRYCRDEADRLGSPARLGSAAASTCGSVTSIADALTLAEGRRAPEGAAEDAVAALLGRAATAVQLAVGGSA